MSSFYICTLQNSHFHLSITPILCIQAFQSLLSSSETEHRQNIWKSCFVLLGMYAFFLVEQLMRAKTCMRCCNKKVFHYSQFQSIPDISCCCISYVNDISLIAGDEGARLIFFATVNSWSIISYALCAPVVREEGAHLIFCATVNS